MGDQKRKGLGMEYHPALSIQKVAPNVQAQHPSLAILPKAEFATIKANQRAGLQLKETQKTEVKPDPRILEFSDPKKNKYFDMSIQSLSSQAPKMRNRRPLRFVKKGKFVNEANKLRAKV